MSIGETKQAEFLIPVILDFLLFMPGRKSGYGAYPFSPSPVFCLGLSSFDVDTYLP